MRLATAFGPPRAARPRGGGWHRGGRCASVPWYALLHLVRRRASRRSVEQLVVVELVDDPRERLDLAGRHLHGRGSVSLLGRRPRTRSAPEVSNRRVVARSDRVEIARRRAPRGPPRRAPPHSRGSGRPRRSLLGALVCGLRLAWLASGSTSSGSDREIARRAPRADPRRDRPPARRSPIRSGSARPRRRRSSRRASASARASAPVQPARGDWLQRPAPPLPAAQRSARGSRAPRSMMFLISRSERPEDSVMRVEACSPVRLSRAVTFTMPSVLISNVTSISTSPRAPRWKSENSNWPSSSFSFASRDSPWYTRITTDCLVVARRGERAGLLDRHRRIALDHRLGEPAGDADLERERRHVEQVRVVAALLDERSGVDRRAHRDHLVGIDVVPRLLLEVLRHRLADRRAAASVRRPGSRRRGRARRCPPAGAPRRRP